jgi:hypothetical protein
VAVEIGCGEIGILVFVGVTTKLGVLVKVGSVMFMRDSVGVGFSGTIVDADGGEGSLFPPTPEPESGISTSGSFLFSRFCL